MKKNDITFDMHQICNVQKSNSLVMSSSFDFTEIEMDMANYITTLVKPPLENYETKEYEYQLVYEVDFNKLCHMTGTMRNGKTYRDYERALEALRTKHVFVKKENGNTTSLYWIQKWEYNNNTGVATIELSDLMIPFIVHLQMKYLTYKPEYTMLMKGKYSKRLYEELKAFYNGSKNGGKVEYQVKVESLKKRFFLSDKPTYANFNNFQTKTIIPAINEINKRTDILVEFELIKTGKKVESIKFIICQKQKEEIDTIEAENQNMIKRTDYEYSENKLPKLEIAKELYY